MKRFFAFILATMMIISIVPISPVIALGAATFSVSETKGSAGEEVTLSINVESNPGVVVIGLQIGYDSSVLELKSAAVKDFADTSFGPTTGNPFHVTWEDVLNPNNTNDGVIAELTFLIKADAPLGDTAVTVSYDEENIFNSNFNNVYFATQNGKVTVVEKTVSVTGVTIDETLSVNIGEKKTPSYAVIPGNASNKAVSFMTGNASIASVNEATGEITGVSKGSTIITVTTADGGFTDTCAVTVFCTHTNKTNTAEKTPTCTEQGWEAYSHCDVCGQLFNAIGIEISEIPYLDVLPHTPADPVKENEVKATCESAGGYDNVVYCTACGEELSREHKTTLATGHEWNDGIVTKAATCTQDGVRTYTCKHDEHHTYTEVIPATGHTPSGSVRENEKTPTCEVNGSYDEVIYCSVCHAEISRNKKTIPATGHEWNEGVVTTPATCIENGVKTFTCKHDASHTYTDVIPATGHTPAEAVKENEVAATCCAEGSYDEVTYCSICKQEVGREHKTIPIDEDAHDWGEWIQTNAPTETDLGEEARTCKHNSSHKETREIPALGPSQVELSFLDDEVIIVVPNGATPNGSEFDVQKIIPPPAEVVEKVKQQMGSSSEVIAYYEVRLTAADGTMIIHLDGEITIKVKMPEQYVGSKCVRILQEDETEKLIVMESWWEGEYLCYKTNWLEIYN